MAKNLGFSSWPLRGILFLILGFRVVCPDPLVSQSCSGVVLDISAPNPSQTGTVSSWVVPSGGPYKLRITAKGAVGGAGVDYLVDGPGAPGAIIAGDFIVTSGQTIEAIAGAPGGTAVGWGSGGGGGGTGARINGGTPILVAGGGGGHGQMGAQGGTTAPGDGNGGSGDHGGGGGGLLSAGGIGFTNGNGTAPEGGGAGFNALGGAPRIVNYAGGYGGGGYGGGGGGNVGVAGGGGGGGYSGGIGGGSQYSGAPASGGGGSFNLGANQNNTAAVNNVGGQIILECLGAAAFTANFTPTQPLCVAPMQGGLSIDLTGDNNGNTSGLEYAIVAGSSFAGSPVFSDITADPFNITGGFGTTGDADGETYTVRVRLKYNPTVFLDYTYTLFAFTGSVIYVNQAAAGANNGRSWTDAFTDLQSALAAACSGIEIWVAAGTYKPTTTTNRGISFSMKNGVAIYGGFPGMPGQEGNFAVRNWVTYETILSGDIGNAGDNTDNTYRIIYNSGLDNSAVLDGFTIRDANNPSSGNGNQGGGMRNNNASPTIVNCTFRNNRVASNGGGVANDNASPVFTNCLFFANYAGSTGGAVYTEAGTPSFINCTISANTAGLFGGAIRGNNFFGLTNHVLKNCIIWGNTASGYNPIYNSAGATSTITNSIVQGGYPGAGNLNADPLFVDAANGNFGLQQCSQAIDAGDNTGAPAKDLDGNTRPFNATGSNTVDMGAYEYQTAFDACTSCYPSGILYVNDDAAGANNGTSWVNAFVDLQDALAKANQCPNITQIWVAAGTYKPTTTTNRGISFSMKNGVAIYGGFPGMPGQEGNFAVRNWVTYETILSGDIGNAGDNTDNTYRIIYNSGLDNSAVLDGFTIRDANNPSSGNGNQGGGMRNNNASPTIVNCTFRNNRVASNGGGVANDNASPVFTNCLFFANYAGSTGGAVYTEAGTPSFINCTISANTAGLFGGAIRGNNFFGLTNHVLKNCIIWGNTASGYNPIYNSAGATSTITNSIVQGGYPGAGNLNADPLFVDEANGNFGLQSCSPAIDAGDNTANGLNVDLGHNPRLVAAAEGCAPIIDLGAFEFQGDADADNDGLTCFLDADDNDPAVGIVPFTSDNGLSFDGTNDYVSFENLPCATGGNTFGGGNAITVEYWFKGSNGQSAVRFQNNSDYIVTAWSNSKHILSNDGATDNGLPVGPCFADGLWHHIAFTWQRNTANGFRSYLDGQLVAQRNSSNNPLPSFDISNMYLGANGGNDEFLNGTLNELRVWNVVRTPAQIAAGMNSSLTLPQAGLALYYKFDHGVANGSNSGVDRLANSVDPSTFLGALHNFALTGNNSNWVDLEQQAAALSCSGELLNISMPFESQNGTAGCLVVPDGGPYKMRITAKGARGGVAGNVGEIPGGSGAAMTGEFILSSGQRLRAIAGAPGQRSSGGGGSGVEIDGGNLLILAGGGGGAIFGGPAGGNGQITTGSGNGGPAGAGGGGGGYFSGGGGSTGGGGGFNAMGGYFFYAFPTSTIQTIGGGGFGGGGAFDFNGGGGGGGYDGGAGGGAGGGGGSYNIGANQMNSAGANYAGGQVILECLGPASFSADFTATQPVCAQGSLVIDLNGDGDGYTDGGLEYAIVSGNSFSGTPSFAAITSDPFNITSGFGTTGDADGETYTVRVRLKYNPGLFVDYTYTMYFTDNTLPNISCPASQTLNVGQGCSVAVPDYTSLANASDNCGILSVTQDPAPNAILTGLGSPTITLKATDVKGNTQTCTFTVSLEKPIAGFDVTAGSLCMAGAKAPVGLSGSQVGVRYQLRQNNADLGMPHPGTGSEFTFGEYPAGVYTVVATDDQCGNTAEMNGPASVLVGPCSIAAPNHCVCENPDGRAPVTVSVSALPGQNWTVKDVIGLYSTASLPPPAAPTPLMVGTPLNYTGNNTYSLDALRLNDKGFWVRVTNGMTDLDIAVGVASW